MRRQGSSTRLGVGVLAALLLGGAALAIGWARDSGPRVHCPAGQPFDLAPFDAQIPDFLQRFRDPDRPHDLRDLRGRFRSDPDGPPDLYASADAVYILWIRDALPRRTTPDGRRAWAAWIQSFQDPQTGLFDRGPRLGHSAAHATAMATAALRLLGHRPAHPLRYAESLFSDAASIEAWLDGFGWRQIWTGSHEAGAAAALLDAPEGVSLPADWIDPVLDALTRRADARSGLWKRAPRDRLLPGPTAIDLGGAAHFWWLYARAGRPVPFPERATESLLALQRSTGLWGTNLFGGAFPQGLDFDALNGLRLAWRDVSPGFRRARRAELLAALDRYACAADHHLNAESSAARLFRNPHKLVGTLNALAELNLLHRELTGRPRVATPRPWRSALDAVAWQ